MEIPDFVHQKFRQAFGPEATEFIVTWMQGADSNRADIAELRHEMQVGFARLEALIERRISDLMKWSFVFWIGAVISIAVLAKVIR
jgi:non-ribosomal peptide synthetase component E (peptide arylation enzyme)